MFKPLSLLLLPASLLMGGCAISGGGDDVAQSQSTIRPIAGAPLPPLLADPNVVGDDRFLRSADEMLAVRGPESVVADIQSAYASVDANQPLVTTERSSLKPFVGRWVVDMSRSRERVTNAVSGVPATPCEIVLEDSSSGSGFKATGTPSCPTSLFMLDSWVAFDNRLVLRDYMGEEIVRLQSRNTGIWVGVNKEGRTLVLNKT